MSSLRRVAPVCVLLFVLLRGTGAYNTSVICGPRQSNPRYKAWIWANWQAARRLNAVLEAPAADAAASAAAMQPLRKRERDVVVNAFNSFWSGRLDHGPNASYIRIWKCGNNALMGNIDAYYNANMSFTVAAAPPGMCTYTFVREPMERFASAYNEVEWRFINESITIKDPFPDSTFHTYPLGSAARVRAFVSDLAEFRLFKSMYYKRLPSFYDEQLRGDVLHHIFPMSGVLAHVPHLEFVGRLSSFWEDWHAVKQLCGLQQIRTFVPYLGDHESSLDPYGTYAAAAKVLSEDCTVYCIMYHILVADFMCFDYKPSPRCGCASA